MHCRQADLAVWFDEFKLLLSIWIPQINAKYKMLLCMYSEVIPEFRALITAVMKSKWRTSVS